MKNKYRHLVAIEPVSLIPSAEAELSDYAERVTLHTDIPSTPAEIVRRIGDADAVLLSYTTTLTADILSQCPSLRYVGMCCSLYSPESANVDIRYADSRGIRVTGIRDYGDEGVVEYVVHQLVALLHGFGQPSWETLPREITGLQVGIVGLGKSGGMIADALRFFGADICYFARAPKPEAETKGYRYRPLSELLQHSDVVCCCLNKNTVLLHDAEFEALGNGKILFNTGLSPAWDDAPFRRWLEQPGNRCFCDTLGALGAADLLTHPQVACMQVSTGRTSQAFVRLSQKVLDNLRNSLL